MNEHMNTDNAEDLEIKSSVRWKLVIAMSVMIVAIVSSLTMLLINNQRAVFEKHLLSQTASLKEQMNIKADKISDVMASQLHRLLAKNLPEDQVNAEVRQYIRGFVLDIEDLRYVILMEGRDLFFAKGIKLNREMKNTILKGRVAKFALSQSRPKKHDFELDELAFRESIVPFKVFGSPWVLRLGFPLDELNKAISEIRETIDREIQSAFIQATLTAVLFIVLGGIAVFFLANRWTRRIKELVSFSHELAGGNFSATPHISVRTNDEVGVLVSSLEEMAASLRKSYAQLEEYSHTLEDKVDKRTLQLAEARDNALAATRAKSEFLANMSHEIRTPMNAIIGLTHLAMDRETDSKQRDYMSKIHSAAKSLLGIINDILDVSKVEAGKLDMEMVEFELEQVLNNLSSVSWEAADEKGLELIFDFPSDTPILIGDPLRLGQVLLNLTTNAIKFTEGGRIDITTEILEQGDGMVQLRFSVTDTGIGISDEQQAKLFQSFTQADSSTTRKYRGTGLGLSISKQLVELMGGELVVESSPGVGSTFSFSVRFATAKQHTGRELIVPDEIRDLRVIIADHNASSRDILDRYLTGFGYETLQLASGDEVLSALSNAPVDKGYQLVLISWKLSDMNGIEAAFKIINAGLQLTPKQMLVTAYGRNELRARAQEAGMDGFLVKPVSPSTLLESIQGVFNFGNAFTCIEEESSDISLESLAHFDGAHLLVAEDNEINKQVAEGLLSRVGISMRFANNGEEAITALGEETFDAILMDMQMPVMGGLEATRKIRENNRYKDIPIIAMTANVMEGDRERCIESG
ncbi:MAG: response regulator, partial [Mariprofundaceae bacterium]